MFVNQEVMLLEMKMWKKTAAGGDSDDDTIMQ